MTTDANPLILRRARGDWLAISPAKALLRFGVIGESEADATGKYLLSLKKWQENLSAAKV